MNRKTSLLESLVTHAVLLAAVGFALYPVLWVVSLAFSGARSPEPSALPFPTDPTLAHLHEVVGRSRPVPGGGSEWLFGRQLVNSLVVSGAAPENGPAQPALLPGVRGIRALVGSGWVLPGRVWPGWVGPGRVRPARARPGRAGPDPVGALGQA